MMRLMGIDPGLSGALAVYDGEKITELAIPTFKAATRGREVDWGAIALWLAQADVMSSAHVFIERVGARPGQGTASMFKFGYVAGGLRGLVAAYALPVTLVAPGVWKKALGLSASKDAARARASELFPLDASKFSRVKDDGVAEAALIAYYGHLKLTKE